MELRCNSRDPDGDEAWLAWRWDVNLGTRMQVKPDWVKVRHTSQDLNGDDTRPGWRWEVILRPEWGWDENLRKFMGDRSRSRDLDLGERWPGWRCYARDAMLKTWMELSHKFWYPDGAQIDPRSGLECKSWKTERGWGVTWMVLGRSHGKLDRGETPI